MSEEILATDWTQILVTFRSPCYHCGKEVPPGKAFWSNSAKAAKHLRCRQTKDENVITKEKLSIENVGPHNISDSPMASWMHFPQIVDLKCYLCGSNTGCLECSFQRKCLLRFSSDQYCICMTCSNNGGGGETYEKYKRIFVQNVETELNF